MQNPTPNLTMNAWQNVSAMEGGHVCVCMPALVEKATSACALGAAPTIRSRKLSP
jgi:hypothetical protein